MKLLTHIYTVTWFEDGAFCWKSSWEKKDRFVLDEKDFALIIFALALLFY